MYSLLVFLLPSIIGLKFMDLLNKFKSIKNIIIYYLMLVLFSNFICSIIIIIMNKFNGNLSLYINEHLMFASKYIILSLIINIVLSFILSICRKHFSITLEVQHEKKIKKNN